MSNDDFCACCGSTSPWTCECRVYLVDEEDRDVGYHAQVWVCDTHRRRAD